MLYAWIKKVCSSSIILPYDGELVQLFASYNYLNLGLNINIWNKVYSLVVQTVLTCPQQQGQNDR